MDKSVISGDRRRQPLRIIDLLLFLCSQHCSEPTSIVCLLSQPSKMLHEPDEADPPSPVLPPRPRPSRPPPDSSHLADRTCRPTRPSCPLSPPGPQLPTACATSARPYGPNNPARPPARPEGARPSQQPRPSTPDGLIVSVVQAGRRCRGINSADPWSHRRCEGGSHGFLEWAHARMFTFVPGESGREWGDVCVKHTNWGGTPATGFVDSNAVVLHRG